MLPIVATSLLQVLYDTADKAVVGQFSGDDNAIAAIGSTTFITGLIINFMIGVGAGAGVAVAQAFGAKDKRGVERTVHNAIILGIGMSVVMTAIGYATAAPLLRLLDTKEVLFDSALLYINIIYSSILATAIYNMGASILRAVGDSTTSLNIGIVSGLINVVLNIILVLCGLSIAGVAIATVASKYYSAVAVMVVLYRRKGEMYAFDPKKMRAHRGTILRMLRLGVPTGLQSACFSLANLASTAALNSFPNEIYISARSIGTDIDHISSTVAGAFLPAAMTATAQNAGARKPERVKRVFAFSMLQAFVIVGVLSNLLRIFAGDISHIFIRADDPDILAKTEAVQVWCNVMLSTHFLAGVLNSATGVVRGLGYSMTPLILNLIGTVGARLVWIYGYFFNLPERTLVEFEKLAYMYPISWGATALLIAVLCIVAFSRLEKTIDQRNEKKAATAAEAARAAEEAAKEAEEDGAVEDQPAEAK